MNYSEWFSTRLAQLRQEKGVSARDMSLSLGQSESYINKIENKRTLPSMTGFFYICEYLNVEPYEFFDSGNPSPTKTNQLVKEIDKLSADNIDLLLLLAKKLKR